MQNDVQDNNLFIMFDISTHAGSNLHRNIMSYGLNYSEDTIKEKT